MCFMTFFWNEVLERFHVVYKKLQSVNIELGMIVELYGSLGQYISIIIELEIILKNMKEKLHKYAVEYSIKKTSGELLRENANSTKQ